MTKIFRILGAIMLTLAIGGVGALITYSSNPSWYSALNLPPVTPPAWVFGPVWTIIYVLLGLALARIWEYRHDHIRQRWLCQFFGQIIFNLLWVLLFFGLHSLLFSWIDTLFLFLTVFIMFVDSYEHDRPSAYYLAPYLAWVTYAGILNFWIWWIN